MRDEKTVLEFMEQSLFRKDLTAAEQIMDLFDKISEKPLKTGKDYADMYYSANFYTYKTFDELVASEAEQGSYGFTREECEAEINRSIWQLPCGWWVQRV